MAENKRPPGLEDFRLPVLRTRIEVVKSQCLSAMSETVFSPNNRLANRLAPRRRAIFKSTGILIQMASSSVADMGMTDILEQGFPLSQSLLLIPLALEDYAGA